MDGILVIVFSGLGLACGAGLRWFFRRMPTRWLLDFDETQVSDALLAAQRLPWWPDSLLLMLSASLCFGCAWLEKGWSVDFGLTLAACLPLILIMVADFKTRIIPDQFTLAVAVIGLFFWLAGVTEGQSAWLSLFWRLLAGLLGGGLLFLVGLLGSWWLQKEAMGMGDVKLLAACSWLVGLDNLAALLFLSFITAAIFAVPQMIRRRLKPAIPNPETGVPADAPAEAGAGFPANGSCEPLSASPAEAPGLDADAIAFGPFIALATLLILLVASHLHTWWRLYLELAS